MRGAHPHPNPPPEGEGILNDPATLMDRMDRMDRIGIILNGVSPILVRLVSADSGLAIFLVKGWVTTESTEEVFV